ncbi:hypothetical protein L596_028334 [Steinernema carpocapsae]|uniref:Uncharacterized protein n=1 Tax=Steinernema carpocapsae TaxID=34508 RepID=A0A4U5LY65_STECR|nr:hypothetical protein L596_028334 [Steinernema carpocapsae]
MNVNAPMAPTQSDAIWALLQENIQLKQMLSVISTQLQMQNPQLQQAVNQHQQQAIQQMMMASPLVAQPMINPAMMGQMVDMAKMGGGQATPNVQLQAAQMHMSPQMMIQMAMAQQQQNRRTPAPGQPQQTPKTPSNIPTVQKASGNQPQASPLLSGMTGFPGMPGLSGVLGMPPMNPLMFNMPQMMGMMNPAQMVAAQDQATSQPNPVRPSTESQKTPETTQATSQGSSQNRPQVPQSPIPASMVKPEPSRLPIQDSPPQEPSTTVLTPHVSSFLPSNHGIPFQINQILTQQQLSKENTPKLPPTVSGRRQSSYCQVCQEDIQHQSRSQGPQRHVIKVHMRNAKIFECPYCKYNSNYDSAQVVQHMKAAHKDKPHTAAEVINNRNQYDQEIRRWKEKCFGKTRGVSRSKESSPASSIASISSDGDEEKAKNEVLEEISDSEECESVKDFKEEGEYVSDEEEE